MLLYLMCLHLHESSAVHNVLRLKSQSPRESKPGEAHAANFYSDKSSTLQ